MKFELLIYVRVVPKNISMRKKIHGWKPPEKLSMPCLIDEPTFIKPFLLHHIISSFSSLLDIPFSISSLHFPLPLFLISLVLFPCRHGAELCLRRMRGVSGTGSVAPEEADSRAPKVCAKQEVDDRVQERVAIGGGLEEVEHLEEKEGNKDRYEKSIIEKYGYETTERRTRRRRRTKKEEKDEDEDEEEDFGKSCRRRMPRRSRIPRIRRTQENNERLIWGVECVVMVCWIKEREEEEEVEEEEEEEEEEEIENLG